jgi:hypothetical protein
MIIGKKPPRPHALGEPLLFNNHPVPRTRREFLAAGLISGGGMVIGPAWLAGLLKPGSANAGQVTLSQDIASLLQQSQCNVPTTPGGIPFICFDLAGGANLIGSEVLVGVQGGQANFLSTAGYGRQGVPGNMVPSSTANIDASLGLLWHADGAIKRGIMSKATTPATAAGTNGAVFCAMSQNDTQSNPHNPMYMIAKAGAKGLLLTLTGTESSVSGGNSMAPMMYVDPALQPTTITQPSDATGLVSTGGAPADPVSVAVMESQARISGGTALYTPGSNGAFSGALSAPSGGTPGVSIYPASDPTYAADDGAIKNQVRCNYVAAAHTAAKYGDPASLDATKDPFITGGTAPIFTMSDFQDGDVASTATIMKLVIGGYAGAGTIAIGGYDYHDGTRATGEMRNFKAGQMIGAVLEYAQRMQTPVMIYVFSDGSLTSTGMPDNSVNGRGKLGWQGDNESVSSTFFLVYSPKGRPKLRNGVAGQQIGYFSADGSVVSTSSPVANNVTALVQAVVLNYMGLQGTDANFANLFAPYGGQSLGSGATLAGLTAFNKIV